MKDQIKWLCIMAALSCLLIGAAELGSNARRFLQEERQETGSGVWVEEIGENPGESDAKEGREKEADKENDDSAQEEILRESLQSLRQGVAGILRGSVGLAERILSLPKRIPPQPEQSKEKETPSPEQQLQEEELGPPVVYLVSDLHYISEAATDYGKAFEAFQAKSDGKVARYLPQVLDALIEEASSRKPDALILTGDITMNGEKINHEKLAEKLSRLQESGVQVLVIPGNHDINNLDAAVYFGDKAEKTQAVTPEEYGEIYKDFGWNQAVSRDAASFSYIYALREDVWLMMLDTAQYEPVNLVDGRVRQETMAWMDANLQAAKDQGIQVIVLGHHNLLSESRMFTTMCILENGNDVTALLERYQVPLYISGHLHLQRTNQHKKGPGDKGYGIYEIVSDAISIPPCQYGILSWQENRDLRYKTCETDVGAWALAHGEEDENLLNFSQYKTEYIRQLVGTQIKADAKQVREKTSGEMAKIYADAYADYCAGNMIDEREAMRSREYKQWENCWPQSKRAEELRAMLGDCSKDYNELTVPGMAQ